MRARLIRLRVFAAALCLLIALIISAIPPVSATPAVTFTGNSTASGFWDEQISLSSLQLVGAGDPDVSVELHVPKGTINMTTTTGLSFAIQEANSLVFTGTMTNVNAALATLYFEAADLDTVTLTASVMGAGEVYWPENGHIYEYVPVGGNINWVNANTAAQARTNSGLNGYLATITSAEENAFVAARLTGAGWMGASDAGAEGVWKWVTGPEAGTTFWNGAVGGSVVPGQYENWNENEPNDSGNEDCAQYLVSTGDEGQWNDLNCSTSMIAGYVVEYGDADTVPEVATKNVTIDVEPHTHNIGTCEDLQDYVTGATAKFDTLVLTQDIDCSGVTFEPLFQDTPFGGVFDGRGYTISNVDIGKESSDNVGLFSKTSGASLHDVTLFGGIAGDNSVGGLIGEALNTNVAAVASHVDIRAVGNDVGGVVGKYIVYEPDISFYDSSATGNITGGESIGGLIGSIFAHQLGELNMFHLFATGNVTSTDLVGGGLIGYISIFPGGTDGVGVNLYDAYATGDVSAPYYAGGLLGKVDVNNATGTELAIFNLQRTYASGDVTTNETGGGLIGEYVGPTMDAINVTISNNFATGSVTVQDPTYGGGLVGVYLEDKAITANNNYFDEARTGQTACSGSALDDFPGCTGISSSQPNYFFNNTTNAPLNAWDFDSVWVSHYSTYPTFATIAGEFSDLDGDHVSDIFQSGLSSYISPITGKRVVIDVGSGCEITTDDITRESSLAVQDPGYDYENGLFDFAGDCGTPGFTTTIKLYYYDVSKAGLIVRKFNPLTHVYSNLTTNHGATLSETTIDGHIVTVASYRLTDGGPLDLDGQVNGEFEDPAGVARSNVGAPNTGLPRR